MRYLKHIFHTEIFLALSFDQNEKKGCEKANVIFPTALWCFFSTFETFECIRRHESITMSRKTRENALNLSHEKWREKKSMKSRENYFFCWEEEKFHFHFTTNGDQSISSLTGSWFNSFIFFSSIFIITTTSSCFTLHY